MSLGVVKWIITAEYGVVMLTLIAENGEARCLELRPSVAETMSGYLVEGARVAREQMPKL